MGLSKCGCEARLTRGCDVRAEQVERRVQEMRAGVERMQEGVKEIVEEEARKMRIEEV